MSFVRLRLSNRIINIDHFKFNIENNLMILNSKFVYSLCKIEISFQCAIELLNHQSRVKVDTINFLHRFLSSETAMDILLIPYWTHKSMLRIFFLHSSPPIHHCYSMYVVRHASEVSALTFFYLSFLKYNQLAALFAIFNNHLRQSPKIVDNYLSIVNYFIL